MLLAMRLASSSVSTPPQYMASPADRQGCSRKCTGCRNSGAKRVVLRLRRGRQLGNRCLRRRMHMKKISVIGATLVAAAVLWAAPISLQQSQDKGLSLSVDKAQARIGHPLTPGSIAGVHRRVERRAYRRGYYGGGYGRGYYGRGYYGRGYYGGGYGR